MMRALAIVWLFAGLRKDEIARLRIGCVRRQTRGDEKHAKDGASVCLLDVPANKTSGGYTKPVHGAVREAIEVWQQVRPAMQAVTDEKTGEVFQVLFGYRGRSMGSAILNHSVIPMLCRKADVPGSDVRGPITSHRARSTIATQLYNAKEPMSLLALKEWLGHRCLASTQWYATAAPDKLTQAYVDARYFERNVAVVQVLLDRAVIESGAAGRGESYKFVHLGHGYCANPYWHNASIAWPASNATSMCRETRRERRRLKRTRTTSAPRTNTRHRNGAESTSGRPGTQATNRG
jgi:hypothetical protein